VARQTYGDAPCRPPKHVQTNGSVDGGHVSSDDKHFVSTPVLDHTAQVDRYPYL
jgi:hypothetical protein